MAAQENTGATNIAPEVIGKAIIVYGSVQAMSPEGMTRILQPNSPVYLNDRILTGSSGAVSIVFDDGAGTQLDLGRMSDMVIDQEVFGGATEADAATAAAEVEQIQQALEAGEEFDPTTELEATAAGPAAGGGADGGGHPVVRFDLDGNEVTPESGAETTGVTGDFTGTEPGTVPPAIPVPPVVAAAPAPVFFSAPVPPDIPDTPTPIPPSLDEDRVVQEEAMIRGGSEYFARIHEIEGEDASTIDHWHFTVQDNPDSGSKEWVNFKFQAEGYKPWPDLDSDHPDGDPNQADLDLHVRIYQDDGSGGLGSLVAWDHLNSFDQGISAYLNEGQNYILVVGDEELPWVPDGTNPDGPPVEHGPYKVTIAGNIEFTQIPEDGYITSMPSLSDGNPDQNDALEDAFQPDSAVVSGNLGDGSWVLANKSGLPNLSSQGWQIQYQLINDNGSDTDIIRAWALPDWVGDIDDPGVLEQFDGDIPGRLVFTLEVDPNGDYRFYQTDQIDNVPPGVANPDGTLGDYGSSLFDIEPGDLEAAEENFEMVIYDDEGNPIGWIDTLDFSGNLQVSFPSGHPSAGTWSFGPGSFTIQSEDDTPIAVNQCFNGITVWIEEDGMSAKQGYPEGYNEVADRSEGAKLPGYDDNTQDEASGSHWEGDSIAQLFKVGADEYPREGQEECRITEDAKFGITDNEEIINALPKLWSQGEQVEYKVVGDTLVAYVPHPEPDGGDNINGLSEPKTVAETVGNEYESLGRIIFTFTVFEDGSWKLDQDDQLDHVDQLFPESYENWDLRSGDAWDGEGSASIPGLDLSSILTVTDYDGDTLVGAGEGQFVVNFQDDKPEFSYNAQAFYVSEFAGYNNIVGTYHLSDWGFPTTNEEILIRSTNEQGDWTQFDNNKPLGEFDMGSKLFIIPDGASIDPHNAHNVDIVRYWSHSDHEWKFVPRIDGKTYWDTPVYFMDNQFNPDGKVHFLDENGDPLTEIPPEGCEIHIEDLPNLGDHDYDDAVLRIQVGPAVNEANLPDGTDPDSAALTVTGNLLTGQGGFKIDPGADEYGTLTVNANAINQYNTGGDIYDPESSDPASLVMDGSGESITIYSQTGTLIINDDWTWSYELTSNTLEHPDNDKGGADHTDGDSDRGTGDQVQDIFDLTYEDFDGDSIHPQMVININDDGPKVCGAGDRMVDESWKYSTHDNFYFDYGADGGTLEIVALNSDATWDPDTGTLTAVDGTYEVVLDPDGTGYTYNILAPSDHPDPTDHDDKIYHNFAIKVTDGDGDTAYDKFTIRLDDDGPNVEISDKVFATGFVHEDALNDGTTPASSNVGNNPDTDFSAGLLDSSQQTDQTTFNLSDHITLEDYGYDGPGSLAFSIIDPEGVDSGLTTAGGETVYYYKDAGTGNLVARTSETGENIFEVSLEEDSVSGDMMAVFNLNDQLDHIKAGADGVFGSADDEPMDPSGTVPAGDAGSLVIDNLGQYIQVTITDGDGDTDSETFEGLINVDVENDVPEAVQPDPGVPQNLNLILVLDRSGSMAEEIDWAEGDSTSQVPRMQALQNAVVALLGSLDASGAANIVVHMVDFSTSADSLGTFVIKGGDGSDPGLAEAETAVNGLQAGGFTNWEDGLMVAGDWASGGTSGIQPLVGADVVNQVIFISDGDPNRYNRGEGDDDVQGWGGDFDQTALDDVLGQHDDFWPWNDDSVNDAEALENLGYTVRVVGINVDGNQDDRLDLLDSTDDAANITSASQLIALLPDLVIGGGPLISAKVIEEDMDPFTAAPVVDYADGTEGPGTGDEDGSGQSLSELFNPGADEPLTYRLDLPDQADLANLLPKLQSGGQTVTYSLDNPVYDTVTGDLVSTSLTASVGGQTVFTFTVEADGDWSIDLRSALDHVAGEGKNFELLTEDGTVDGIDLSALIHAFDTDLDPVQAADGAFVLSIQDDIAMKEGPAQDAILVDEAGNNLVADLNIDPGADGISLVQLFPLDGAGVRLEDGDQVYANGEPFEYQGNPVTWQYNSTDGSWDAVVMFSQTVEFTTAKCPVEGAVLFTVAPEMLGGEYTGNYTVEQFADLLGDKQEFGIDFENEKGGHGTELVRYDGDVKITFTADDPGWDQGGHNFGDYVNWSNKGVGVGNNFIDEDYRLFTETLKMSFSDTSDIPLDMTSVTIGLNHLDNTGGPTEFAHWEAYSWEGGQRVMVGSGDVEGDGNPSIDKSLTIHIVDDNNDTVTFQEVEMSYRDGVFPETAQGYRVSSVEGTYYEGEEELELDFDAELTDGDGDVEGTSFDVTFDADGVVEGGDEPEVIAGSTGEDVLDGGGGDDVIYGNEGDDIIYGGEGDDTIVGGEGEDELLGGPGDDEITGDNIGDSSDPGSDTFDTAEEGAGEVTDYDPDPAPVGDEDLLDNLVPPVV